jgi:hypothetical protein
MGLQFPKLEWIPSLSIKGVCVCMRIERYTAYSMYILHWGANSKYRRLNDSRIGLYWPSFVTVLLCQLYILVRIEKGKWWARGFWVPAHVFSLHFFSSLLLFPTRYKVRKKKVAFFSVCVRMTDAYKLLYSTHPSWNQPPYFLIQLQLAINLFLSVLSLTV